MSCSDLVCNWFMLVWWKIFSEMCSGIIVRIGGLDNC